MGAILTNLLDEDPLNIPLLAAFSSVVFLYKLALLSPCANRVWYFRLHPQPGVSEHQSGDDETQRLHGCSSPQRCYQHNRIQQGHLNTGQIKCTFWYQMFDETRGEHQMWSPAAPLLTVNVVVVFQMKGTLFEGCWFLQLRALYLGGVEFTCQDVALFNTLFSVIAGFQIRCCIQQHHSSLLAYGSQYTKQRSSKRSEWYWTDPNLDQTVWLCEYLTKLWLRRHWYYLSCLLVPFKEIERFHCDIPQQIPDATSYALVYIEAIILGMLAAGMPAYFAMDHTRDREVITYS